MQKKKLKGKKISEMVLDFAGSYIDMGENIEEKQQLLIGAVSAWNIACLDPKSRKRAIKKYMAGYRELNPTHSKKDFQDAKRNLLLLIQQKEKYYPEVNVQITDARIDEIDGKNHVRVAYLSLE